jgi:hypothetical protein
MMPFLPFFIHKLVTCCIVCLLDQTIIMAHLAPTVHRVAGGAFDVRFRNVINEKLRDTAASLGLVIPDNNKSDFVYLGRQSVRFRNRPLEETTKETYEEKFRQLWKFLAIKGDYESMLMLLPTPPMHCPSMNANSLEEFFRFKRQQAGTQLKDERGNPVQDILGNVILCDGRWKSPYMDTYKASISDLHATNGQTSNYGEPCPGCLDLTPDIQHQGCEHHRGHCRIRRVGNPVESVIFTNTSRQQKIWANQEGYEEQGCSQFLPSDVRRLRTYFIGQNTIVGLQYWCCTIIAILLALRHDEFHEIDNKNFLPALFEVTGDRVDCLVLQVMGKSDARPITFRLNTDNDHPEFCPVRPLLVYMHLMGYKGGYLFPSSGELNCPPTDGIFTTKIDYDHFKDLIQRVCLQVLPQRENFKVGCHIFRKTYYVFGIFGYAHDGDLQRCARHLTLKHSMTYRKTASSLFQTYLRKPTPENAVSRWQPTMIDADGQENSRVLMLQGGYMQMGLTDIADFFVFDILKMPRGQGSTTDIVILMAHASAYTILKTPEEEINAVLSRLGADDANTIRVSYDRLFTTRLAMTQTEFQRQLEIGHADEPTASETQIPQPITPAAAHRRISQEITPAATHRRISQETPTTVIAAAAHSPPDTAERHQKVDLEERKTLKNMNTTMEKMEALVRIDDERANGSLTSGAKTFASKFLKPAISCLKNHCGGSCVAFAEKYPDFNHTTFPTTCCGGEGPFCAPK